MGTETPSILSDINKSGQSTVKLNNPQMGTETLIHLKRVCLASWQRVKLNNPQMGTETIIIHGTNQNLVIYS